MTIAQAKSEGIKVLSNSATAALDTELLLTQVMKCDRAYLISHDEGALSSEQELNFSKLISERATGKPIAYIIKNKEFFGRDFYVDERVMIPRPETEEMVEDALLKIKANNKKSDGEKSTIIDLGTGSGAIAITVAILCPELEVFGLDISDEALDVAKINHKRYPSQNLKFIESDLLSNLPSTIDDRPLTILANLPYIGTESNHFVSEETDQFEPHLALYGGNDGLDLYRRTWEQLKTKNLVLKALYMEIGFSQAEQIKKEASDAFPDYLVEIKNDLAGLPRTLIIIDNKEI